MTELNTSLLNSSLSWRSTITAAVLIVLFLHDPVAQILALSPFRTQIHSLCKPPQSCRFPSSRHHRRFVSIRKLDLYRRDNNQALHMNFFKNMLDKAFENDNNLSKDRTLQQYDKPEDEYEDLVNMQTKQQGKTPKTEVQKRWLESQALIKSSTTGNNDNSEKNNPATGTSLYPTKTTAPTLPGAPLSTSLLTNTNWELSLYLTGTPDFDPSSSLFGSRVSISTRQSAGKDESSSPSLASLGFAIGCDVLPTKPSVLLSSFQFLSDGRCVVSPTSFTTGENEGTWTLTEDGKTVRFSIYVEGWKRTVTTKGTIQNVYWSDGDNVERTSKATYSIPSGWVYGEAGVGYGTVPGILDMAPMTRRSGVGGADDVGRGDPTGILRFEMRMGMLGAASKMVPCGMFSAEMKGKSNDEREDQQ